MLLTYLSIPPLPPVQHEPPPEELVPSPPPAPIATTETDDIPGGATQVYVPPVV
jgi:hypothetical protein